MAVTLVLSIGASLLAGFFHARLREVKFSAVTAVVYFAVINLFYVCHMLFYRRQPFTLDAYFGFPKAAMRYAAFSLGSCAVMPLVFFAAASPKKIIYTFKRMAWIKIVAPVILVLSAESFSERYIYAVRLSGQ